MKLSKSFRIVSMLCTYQHAIVSFNNCTYAIFMYFSLMKAASIYILLYNNSVQFASKDIKCLAGALQNMAAAINQAPGLSYVQVTRIIKEKHSYFHAPTVGHAWEIISRELLYTRRRKRPAAQRMAQIENTNP